MQRHKKHRQQPFLQTKPAQLRYAGTFISGIVLPRALVDQHTDERAVLIAAT